jgi:hypothetical protein
MFPPLNTLNHLIWSHENPEAWLTYLTVELTS